MILNFRLSSSIPTSSILNCETSTANPDASARAGMNTQSQHPSAPPKPARRSATKEYLAAARARRTAGRWSAARSPTGCASPATACSCLGLPDALDRGRFQGAGSLAGGTLVRIYLSNLSCSCLPHQGCIGDSGWVVRWDVSRGFGLGLPYRSDFAPHL